MRPGRIDMRVYMGPATASCLREIVGVAYPHERESGRLDQYDFAPLDRKLTPSFVERLFTNAELEVVLSQLDDLKSDSQATSHKRPRKRKRNSNTLRIVIA